MVESVSAVTLSLKTLRTYAWDVSSFAVDHRARRPRTGSSAKGTAPTIVRHTWPGDP